MDLSWEAHQLSTLLDHYFKTSWILNLNWNKQKPQTNKKHPPQQQHFRYIETMYFCKCRKLLYIQLASIKLLNFTQTKQEVIICIYKHYAFHAFISFVKPFNRHQKDKAFHRALLTKRKKKKLKKLVSCGNKRDRYRHNHILFPYRLQFHRKLLSWNLKSLSNFLT